MGNQMVSTLGEYGRAAACLLAIREMIDTADIDGERNGNGQAHDIFDTKNNSRMDDTPFLGRLALEEYRERRRRSKYFESNLFGEPAWDMMLDLFIAAVAEKRLSITALCYGSGSPPTTALRWIGLLEGHALVTRFADNLDKRRTWVVLTTKGDRAMRHYLLDRKNRQRQLLPSLEEFPNF
ncbi:MAG: MarR family transcriptional regulator [Novosphingobium sp.]|uniref:MarR family transcriptional regulator n=1 Tax=Novosphingobium sp. TaxID=1874826 RepID=UPI0032BB4EA9